MYELALITFGFVLGVLACLGYCISVVRAEIKDPD
jgi:hypothetical protein